MAKGLPYFKFTPSEWLTGDICFEDLETQGLFINICAWYWQKDGVLTVSDILKRYNKQTAFNSLSNRFLNIENDLIKIAFLDEQLSERKYQSKVNSLNGSKGGRPKTLIEKPNAFNSLSETKPKENPIRKEEEEKEKKIDIGQTSLSLVESIFIDKTETIWNKDFAKKEAAKFFHFYASKNWMVGKNKMKSLPHAIGGWIARIDKPEPVTPIVEKPILF